MRGSLREKRAGVWELRVYVGRDSITGRQRSMSRTHRGTRRTAETALAALVAEVARERPDPTAVGTVAELAADWLDAVARQRAVLTVQGYRQIVTNYVVPQLGRLKVAAVTVRDLDRYFDALADRGLAASTMNQHRAVLAGMFKMARRWGLITRDPMADVPRRQGSRSERDAVPPELAPVLFETAMRSNPTMAVLLRVAAVTGARRGELCGLQWGDLDGRRLTVRRAVVKAAGKAPEVKDTKSHQVRRVTLDAETVAVLEDHRATMERRARACGVRLGPWMFSTDPACREPMRPGTVSQWWDRLVRRCGHPELRLHGLRHLSASYLLAQGVPVAVVSDRLGHSVTSTTWNSYAHALGGQDAEAAEVAGSLFDPHK